MLARRVNPVETLPSAVRETPSVLGVEAFVLILAHQGHVGTLLLVRHAAITTAATHSPPNAPGRVRTATIFLLIVAEIRARHAAIPQAAQD